MPRLYHRASSPVKPTTILYSQEFLSISGNCPKLEGQTPRKVHFSRVLRFSPRRRSRQHCQQLGDLLHVAGGVGSNATAEAVDVNLLGRHPVVASFFANFSAFLRTYPLPAPAGDNYLVPPFSRFSTSPGIRQHYTLHPFPHPTSKKHQRRYLSTPPQNPNCRFFVVYPPQNP